MLKFDDFKKMSVQEKTYYVESLEISNYNGDNKIRRDILNKIVFTKNENDYNYYLEMLKNEYYYYK